MKRLWFLLICGLLAAEIYMLIAGAQGSEELSLTAMHFKAPEFTSPEADIPGAPEPNTRSPRPASEREMPNPNVSGTEWINSPSLTMAGLRGKVVLIDFWEYTCINCIRTFAENKKWYERYHTYGFEIIGVHDPEFDIAYPADHVRAAVKRFGLPYPVVVDAQFKIWASYNNSTWPNRFLIDANSFVRFNRPGEGADRDFEVAIQRLLQEAHPGLKFPADYTIPPEQNAFAPTCGIPTAEMYVGNWYDRGILANTEGYHKGKTINYKNPGEVKDGEAVVSGPWQTDKNGMIYRGKPQKGGPYYDALEMRYHARELYAVMNVSRGHPSRLFVQQDGKELTEQDKGVDVQIDAQGHSYIDVREARMYYLVQNPSFGQHEVKLIPTAPGTTINSFTFGNDCQTQFPHL